MTLDRVLVAPDGRSAHYLDPLRPGVTICGWPVGMTPHPVPDQRAVCHLCDSRAATRLRADQVHERIDQLGLFGSP